MWLTIGSSMGYNLVPGVSGIIYGVSWGYNQLVLRVSDNSSHLFPYFSGTSGCFRGILTCSYGSPWCLLWVATLSRGCPALFMGL